MKVVAVASLALMAANEVSAHGYLSQPAAKFKPGVMTTNYLKTITESVDTAAFGGKKWNDNPVANAKMFATSFANSKYKTLKALIDASVSDCGFTLTDGTPVDVSKLKSMKWQNDQEPAGLIESHRGPCEGWIDNTKVFHYDDCRAQFPAYPAEIPVDYSSCKGKCQFTFYWLALHEPNWQIYKQCAPIQNGSGGGSSGGSTTPAATSKAPAATSKAPAATTKAPTKTPAPASNEYDDEYTPAPTKKPTTPATTPSATKKCKAKTRRLTANLRSEEEQN